MSIITTTYIQRLTIVTDDAGKVTITRTHDADTHAAYLFDELSPEAQARAIRDAIEEEEHDYYESGIYGSSQTGMSESDILDAARELEQAQPIEIAQDPGCSWYGTARGTSWYHRPANWESVTEQQHNGMCYSMDICDKWNEYAVRIVAMQEGHEEAAERELAFWGVADDAQYDALCADDNEEREHFKAIEATATEAENFYARIRERIEDAAEELTEEAARAVGSTVDSLIEGEREYYSSPEFWKTWFHEGDERFNRDGERI